MLIPIQFQRVRYPNGIIPVCTEVPGHFDVPYLKSIPVPYCLHTEYSAGTRKFSSPCAEGLDALRIKNTPHVPELWRGPEWVEAFVLFIRAFVGRTASGRAPMLLEIHPPFRDYCGSASSFLVQFRQFEGLLADMGCEFLIENRNKCRRGEFLLRKLGDVRELALAIGNQPTLKLKLALDIPQLLNAEGFDAGSEASGRMLRSVFETISQEPVRQLIGSVHLYGVSRTQPSPGRPPRMQMHAGTLDSYLGQHKTEFLQMFHSFVDAGEDLYFLPEVVCGEAVFVRDLVEEGICFVGSAG